MGREREVLLAPIESHPAIPATRLLNLMHYDYSQSVKM
jgi:hypothetical protein